MAKVYGKPDRSKKGGVAGKILCLVIGFVVGIAGTLGGIAGAGYYIYSQPVDKTLSLVDKSGAIYTTLFGNGDSVGLLNEKIRIVQNRRSSRRLHQCGKIPQKRRFSFRPQRDFPENRFACRKALKDDGQIRNSP